MNLIVITNPDDLQREHELINALFDQGLELLHIRKPDYTQSDTEDYLKKIKPHFLRRIVIHQHYKLIGKFNIKGIHLKENYYRNLDKPELKDLMKTAHKYRLSVSLSVHGLQELLSIADKFSYIFLSPVFGSISKSGYAPKEDLRRIPVIPKSEVIALGGISSSTISELSQSNYSGVAVLGEIWKQYSIDNNLESAVARFLNLKQKLAKIEWKQKDPIF